MTDARIDGSSGRVEISEPSGGNGSGSMATEHLSTENRMKVSATDTAAKGMKVPARFCPEKGDVFSTVNWERRTAVIKRRDSSSQAPQNDDRACHSTCMRYPAML